MYRSDVGRSSIHAVFMAPAVTGVLLFGLCPDLAAEQALRHGLVGGWGSIRRDGHLGAPPHHVGLRADHVAQGEDLDRLAGLFVPPLSAVVVVGAVPPLAVGTLALTPNVRGARAAEDGPGSRGERRHREEMMGPVATRVQNVAGGRPDSAVAPRSRWPT